MTDTPSSLRTSVVFWLTRLNSDPRWFGTFMVLSGCSIALYVLMHPFVVNATVASLPQSASLSDKTLLVQTLQSELPLRCAFLPVRLLVGWASFSFMLFAICKAFASHTSIRFQKVFSLHVHAETLNVLAQISIYVYLLLRTDPDPRSTSLVPFSVAMFVKTNTPGMFSLLNSLNFFTLLYIALLTIGISVQSGLTRSKCLTIVVLAWSPSMIFNIGAVTLMRTTMKLLI